MVVIGFAEIKPDGGVGRNHVGLIAAVGDHVVDARGQAQMLAAEFVADAHQLGRIERAASAPGRAGGVRAFAFEHVFDGNQAVLAAGSVGDAEVVGDVREQADVDVLEHSGADVVGFGADQFLGDAGPELEGAVEMLALHHFFDGEWRR